jgi:leukotriene-A4 hydrolase
LLRVIPLELCFKFGIFDPSRRNQNLRMLFCKRILKANPFITNGIIIAMKCLMIVIGCSSCGKKSDKTDYEALKLTYSGDPHTHAQVDSAVHTHIELDLIVDFSAKKIRGKAVYTLQNNKAQQVVLDCKSLIIREVRIGKDRREADYTISQEDPVMGSALTIPIGPLTTTVEITYETAAQSSALQWLDAVQTARKTHPFLYTQSQPHLARTWFPVQDSPGIRFTWNARVQCPKDLLALMSAVNPQKLNPDGIYEFTQTKSVPAYLIALAVGKLEFEALSERTGVYAEPGVVGLAKEEFSRTELMLETAEQLYGTYEWGRYDLLILPPSFPFGGMENPVLTFATPTIIVGDQSLTSLVAHELAHSWSGNQVTCATWNDLWLNEGFTVYFERRIMEKIYGSDFVDLLNVLMLDNLKNLISRMGEINPDTRLKLDLKDRDPDEAMNRIAYDKGYLLLLHLEKELGRPVLDSFLMSYFKHFAFQSIDTESFLNFLYTYFYQKGIKVPEIRNWIYLPGLPENHPVFSSKRANQVSAALENFLYKQDIEKFNAQNWSSHEWRYFISKLPRNTNPALLEQLNQAHNLAFSKNSEIRSAWLELCIYAGLFDQTQVAVESFLIEVGRRKFLMPIYQALVQTDRLRDAKSIYQKARPNYHQISKNSIDVLLDIRVQ